MQPVIRSAPDSARFGLEILRGRLDTVEPKALAKALVAAGADVAILRIPAGQSARIHELRRWALPVLHADTLVHYRCDLSRHAPAALRNEDLALSLAGAEDLTELRALVAGTFRDYTSHYHANPLFPRDDILAGYQEWAEGHLSRKGGSLWIARRAGRIVAFAACQDHAGDEAEGILYGVAPDAAGGGVYGDLIRHTQAVARRRGARSMTVSTQVGNYAVQKVWSREGFHLYEALDTYHVNALLSSGEVLVDRGIRFSAGQIRRFAEASGDDNPLHLDDAAARRAGFPGRIAHGVLALAEFSRILGTESPGPGTVFLQLESAFLKPLLAGHEYRLQLRVPGGVRAGAMQAVLRIDDPSGPCLLGRALLSLRD